jgi:uncharacterized membrane-anchored protein
MGLVVLALMAPAHIAVAAVPKTDQEREAALKSIVWRDGQSLTLPLSKGTLRAPTGIRQLLGGDARTASEVINGVDAPATIEAMLYEPATNALVYYQKLGDGFVSVDDWGNVDPDAFIKTIRENTEADNVKRRENGVPPLHVVGWLEKPNLDRKEKIVRWAIDAIDDDQTSNVNSVALILTRDGFEKLTWIGPKEALSRDLLKTAQTSFRLPVGDQYSDYREGDKVAAYGIAGLVASMLGAKVATKFGLLALVAVFAKKLGALIILPFALGVGFIKRLFKRSKAPPVRSPLNEGMPSD